jgi:transcriptional regulator with XRE-family HTH domain
VDNHSTSAISDGDAQYMAKKLFGTVLVQWRKARNVSQLDLALRAEISQRHVSFMETGRAKPSREMALKLAEALDVPLRARNEVLLAAGYAPFYPERKLDSQEMIRATQILKRMLDHHEPYPAMVLDGEWNIVMKNQASTRIISACLPDVSLAQFSSNGKLNFMRVMCSPKGLRPHIRSWTQTGRVLLTRLRREAAAYPGGASEVLLRELLAQKAFPEFTELADAPLNSVIPLELVVNGELLRLINTLTTFGTPQDVTLQELRIEMSFAADDATDRILRRK